MTQKEKGTEHCLSQFGAVSTLVGGVTEINALEGLSSTRTAHAHMAPSLWATRSSKRKEITSLGARLCPWCPQAKENSAGIV